MESEKRKNPELDAMNPKRCCGTKMKMPLKLADLCEDALVEIFVFLDEQDMFNVIKVDDMFLTSCRAAFRRKHQHKYIVLPFKNPDTDDIDLNRTVQLLKIFGESISKLEFTFDPCNETHEGERIYCDLIVNKCSQSLIEMKLCYPSTELKINKCFKQLKTLKICYGSVDPSMGEFSKWFPVLENLLLDAVDKRMNMARKITSLKCFSVEFSEDCDSGELNNNIHIEELNRFIKYNPQLKEFSLAIDDHNINTEDSVIRFCYDKQLDDNIIPEKMTVKLEQPVDMLTSDYSKALAQLKIPFDRIEHLQVTTERFTKQICDYIAKCVNLKSLRVDIEIFEYLFDDEARIDSTNCKMLTKLEIALIARSHHDHPNIVLTAVQPYFKECKNLNRVCVSYCNAFGRPIPSELSYDTLESQIDHDKWFFDHHTSDHKVLFVLEKWTALEL